MRIKQGLLHLLFSFLIGVSISSALLAFILVTMLERFGKDLAEVVMTGQYITAFIIAATISAMMAYRLWISGR